MILWNQLCKSILCKINALDFSKKHDFFQIFAASRSTETLTVSIVLLGPCNASLMNGHYSHATERNQRERESTVEREDSQWE